MRAGSVGIENLLLHTAHTGNDNFIQCRQVFGLSLDTIATLARNSLTAAFVPPAQAARGVALLDAYLATAKDV